MLPPVMPHKHQQDKIYFIPPFISFISIPNGLTPFPKHLVHQDFLRLGNLASFLAEKFKTKYEQK